MTKKKLIITITSLCLVVVAAVAAVIGIIAATNVAINSNLSVSYTPGAEVIATVKGEYSLNGGEAETINQNSFAYGATTTTFAIDQGAINLTDTNKYVIFAFSFKNDATEDNTRSVVLTVKVTDNSAEDKMTVSKIRTKTRLAQLDKATFDAAKDSTSDTALDSIGLTETGYFYIMVEIQPGVKGTWGTKGGETNTFNFALSAKEA